MFFTTKFFVLLAVVRQSVLRVCRAHLRIIAPAGNTASFEEMLQQLQAVSSTVSDLTGPKFDSHTFHFSDKLVTA